MKKVLIIAKSVPQYRKEFFDLLKIELEKCGVELQLAYGKLTTSDSLKNDQVDISWGNYIPNKLLKIGNTELLWQPCLNLTKGKNLVIAECANKLLVNYYLLFAARFSHYKFAFWGHARNLEENIDSPKNRFKYIYLNKCDWWFGYTKGTKEFLLTRKFPAQNITVVQNAINTTSLHQYYAEINDTDLTCLKKDLGITTEKVGIYCGGMSAYKKIDFILEACKKIKQEVPDFQMIFVGAGVDAKKIQEASLENNWIHYVGAKFNYDRVKYFRISALQLMPAAVGLGILDSFAMETPIVTTNQFHHGPEIEYLENGINGVVTNDNITDYSRSVIDILNNERFIHLIEGCKMAAKRYTLEHMVENFKNGILACLEN